MTGTGADGEADDEGRPERSSFQGEGDPITAHELARALLALPDVMVTINGYEGGVDEVTGVSGPAPILLDAHSEWYFGKHEYMQERGDDQPQAIHIR